MIRHVVLALAILLGLGSATLAVAGLTASSAAACTYNKTT